MELFKIRPSSCLLIMGKMAAGSITAKQAQLVKETIEKKDNPNLKDPTAKQMETMEALVAKRDAKPELPQGAKKYCEDWLDERLYKRRKEITTKEMTRGHLSEDSAINLVSRHLGGFYVKNEKFFENEWIKGTPDIDEELEDLIIDTKCSWDHKTFPLHMDICEEKYEYQVQCYMNLCGRSKAKVIYCLMNLPKELKRDEVRKLVYSGLFEEEAEQKVEEYHTYDDVPIELRIKEYDIFRNDDRIQAIHNRVIMCREYIASIIEKKGFERFL